MGQYGRVQFSKHCMQICVLTVCFRSDATHGPISSARSLLVRVEHRRSPDRLRLPGYLPDLLLYKAPLLAVPGAASPPSGGCGYVLPAKGRKAERVGFEPTRRLNTAYAISNRAPSANSDTSPKNTQDCTRRPGLRRLLRAAGVLYGSFGIGEEDDAEQRPPEPE